MKHAAWTILAVAAVLAVAGAAQAGLSDGLVHYYSFDTDSKDSVGSLDGTLNANGAISGANAKVGGGALMSTSGGATCDLGAPVNFGSGSFSVSYWVTSPQNSGNGELGPMSADWSETHWDIKDCGNLNWYAILVSPNMPYSTFTSKIGQGLAPTNTWMMLTLVVDRAAATATFYKNATGPSTMNISAAGTDSFDSTRNMGAIIGQTGGGIDEWAFWDRALSSAEVSQLYNDGDGMSISLSIPEPASVSLLLLGGAWVIARVRRQSDN
ncbi:MAG: LamG-like jellyroll fold domain-containing protein [Planctomycetaceae bacterium]|nr:PEP-CTERM sorting domain-containing protein [Planctomycetaceae bacterium]